MPTSAEKQFEMLIPCDQKYAVIAPFTPSVASVLPVKKQLLILTGRLPAATIPAVRIPFIITVSSA